MDRVIGSHILFGAVSDSFIPISYCLLRSDCISMCLVIWAYCHIWLALTELGNWPSRVAPDADRLSLKTLESALNDNGWSCLEGEAGPSGVLRFGSGVLNGINTPSLKFVVLDRATIEKVHPHGPLSRVSDPRMPRRTRTRGPSRF
jgi:hypothetical protein